MAKELELWYGPKGQVFCCSGDKKGGGWHTCILRGGGVTLVLAWFIFLGAHKSGVVVQSRGSWNAVFLHQSLELLKFEVFFPFFRRQVQPVVNCDAYRQHGIKLSTLSIVARLHFTWCTLWLVIQGQQKLMPSLFCTSLFTRSPLHLPQYTSEQRRCKFVGEEAILNFCGKRINRENNYFTQGRLVVSFVPVCL